MKIFLIIIMLYLGVGVVIAITPFYILNRLDKILEGDDYNAISIYDILLFNTVLDNVSNSRKILIILSIVLFYPILIIKQIRKSKQIKK